MNQKISKTAHIKELNAEIDRLKAELFATREKNGIYVPADQYEQREESSKKNQFRIEELEAAMEALSVTHQAELKKQLAETERLQQVRPSGKKFGQEYISLIVFTDSSLLSIFPVSSISPGRYIWMRLCFLEVMQAFFLNWGIWLSISSGKASDWDTE